MIPKAQVAPSNSIPARRVWITGAGGLIGSALIQAATGVVPTWNVRGTRRSQVDLTDQFAVEDAFRTILPDIIIHCAAMADTSLCEREPTQARTINVEVTRLLAQLAKPVRLVFFSTDLVFDGARGYYDETALVNPLGVYAETKAEAERLVLMNPLHMVIRTSLNGGTSPTGDRGFNETMRSTWRDGGMLSLFDDEFRCPIPAAVTAQAVWELLTQDRSGLYHIAGSERLSRWEIGQALARRWKHLHPQMKPVSRLSFPGPPRPADTSLNCTKAQRHLSFQLPGFREWLATHPDKIF